MDPMKKRKMEENGVVDPTYPKLTPEDARKIIDRLNPDQLIDIVQRALVRHPDVIDSVRSVADPDTSQRKLFIRGLGWETNTEGLRSLFSAYGEIEEAVVILDKQTGKSKGYGFVTFRHVDGSLLALKEPSKKIDGRMTVTLLAAAGTLGSNANANAFADVSLRKIYVANVPYDMSSDKLLHHFLQYGEMEEGPLGFDKQTGKCRGYALFVYKTPEGAKAALVDPVKNIEGRQLNCKLAIDGKKGKQGGPMGDGVQAHVGGPRSCRGEGRGVAPPSSMTGQFGGPGGMGSYGDFSGGLQGPPPMGHHPLNSVGSGLSSVDSQAPSSLGGAGGYSGTYGGYGGPGSAVYGGMGGAGAGAGTGGGSGAGPASSFYKMPPNSGGMPSGVYPESGQYGLSSSGYPGHQPTGTSQAPMVPSGGMYPPPYY